MNLSLLWTAAPVMASGGAKGTAEARRVLVGAAPRAGGAGTTSLGGSLSTRPGLEEGGLVVGTGPLFGAATGGVTGGGDAGPSVGVGAQLAEGRRCRAGCLARALLGDRASWPNTHFW